MKFHIIAVSGTATATLASILKEKGFEVSGSDTGFYPPMGELIKNLGIRTFEGFTKENVDKVLPLDGVVAGNFISSSNPEAERSIELGLDIFSVPEALYHFAMRGKQRIVVAGTHGKTTTTALVATLLHEAGWNPGFFIGGLPLNFPSSGRLGGKWFVAEGDEYETSFFDKGPKFFHLFPNYLLLGPVEMDHYDIYEDLSSIKRVFSILASMVPSSGLIVSYDSETNREILSSCRARTIILGKDWGLEDIKEKDGGMVLYMKTPVGVEKFYHPAYSTPLALNFALALPLLSELGLKMEEARKGFSKFSGVKRRMELLAKGKDIMFFTDFAHHPSSLALNLRDLKRRFKNWRLVAVVEPASWSMRSGIFQAELPQALKEAEAVILAPPPSKRVKKGKGLDRGSIAFELRSKGVEAYAPEKWEEIFFILKKLIKGKTLVVLFSNANIRDKAEGIKAALSL